MDRDRYDSIEWRNEMPACSSCGSLLCVQTRHQERAPIEGMIRNKLYPRPADDVKRTLCAGCGRILDSRR